MLNLLKFLLFLTFAIGGAAATAGRLIIISRDKNANLLDLMGWRNNVGFFDFSQRTRAHWVMRTGTVVAFASFIGFAALVQSQRIQVVFGE